MNFARRYPALFHVADRAALDGIRRHGLLSARRLVALHNGDPACLRLNREGYRDLAPGAALRRQGLRDGPLRSRLDPAITVEQWRWFINGFVFLFPGAALASRFLSCEPARDQVVLRYATAALLADGVPLRTCRFNNGYTDRSPVATARPRHFNDYQDAAAWSGAAVKEVAAASDLPPAVAFEVLP